MKPSSPFLLFYSLYITSFPLLYHRYFPSLPPPPSSSSTSSPPPPSHFPFFFSPSSSSPSHFLLPLLILSISFPFHVYSSSCPPLSSLFYEIHRKTYLYTLYQGNLFTSPPINFKSLSHLITVSKTVAGLSSKQEMRGIIMPLLYVGITASVVQVYDKE